MINHTDYQDKITRAMEFWEVKSEVDKLKAPEREKVLGLKYAAGQKVKDTVTLAEVEILGGTREIVGLPGPTS